MFYKEKIFVGLTLMFWENFTLVFVLEIFQVVNSSKEFQTFVSKQINDNKLKFKDF